jgi:hypothetical protein
VIFLQGSAKFSSGFRLSASPAPIAIVGSDQSPPTLSFLPSVKTRSTWNLAQKSH